MERNGEIYRGIQSFQKRTIPFNREWIQRKEMVAVAAAAVVVAAAAQRTIPAKSTGSCPTYPMQFLSQRTFRVRRSTPSSITEPSRGS